ncbi:PqiC family protein [Variovorax sp. RHLX14]|uniref:PqiC family protein n=1 Tax=Variovorax sp. RHLX14 TaxID=1259731 RepID=UPI003F457232
MKPFSKIFSGLAACAAALLVAGCASPPDRYFTLAAPADSRVVPANASAVPMFIELAPVAMAERLARPQMLVRKAPASGRASAEVELLEQHRWASSFENEMRDALASGIASRLGAVDLTKGGRQPAQPAWRIAVQLQNFDAVENSRVDAAFSWTVRRSDGERSTTCQWTGSEPVGGGIDALAQGAQRVTAKAADAIARHVGNLTRTSAPGTAVGCG